MLIKIQDAPARQNQTHMDMPLWILTPPRLPANQQHNATDAASMGILPETAKHQETSEEEEEDAAGGDCSMYHLEASKEEPHTKNPKTTEWKE